MDKFILKETKALNHNPFHFNNMTSSLLQPFAFLFHWHYQPLIDEVIKQIKDKLEILTEDVLRCIKSPYVSQQPSLITALASASQEAPSPPYPPITAAAGRTVRPSRGCTHCCCWVSCCWGLEPSPSSPSASLTSTTTPARRTLRSTSVRNNVMWQQLN